MFTRPILKRILAGTVALALSGFATAQGQDAGKRNLYISAPPDAQAIKEEIVKKVAAWNGVSIVTLPERADLVQK